MRPEEQLLFTLARQQFLDAHHEKVREICSNNTVRWDTVFKTATQHQIAPLIYCNLLQCTHMNIQIPQNVFTQFKLSCARNVVMNEHKSEKIMEVLAFAKSNDVDVMLIKGIALDFLVYDQPWYTVSGDVDLIIRHRGREVVQNKDQAEIIAAIQDILFPIRHIVQCECEYFEHHDVTLNGILPIDFQRIRNEASKITFRAQDALVMSPEDMLISVCINSLRKRFFRLKSLCDIAETINKYSDMAWGTLVQKAKEYDCHNIVYTALLTTKITLGCEVPQEVFETLKFHGVRSRVILYVIQHMSFTSLFSLYSGMDILGKRINFSLILTYATFRWYQAWRFTNVVYRRMRQSKQQR